MNHSRVVITGAIVLVCGLGLVGADLFGGPESGKLDVKIQSKPTVMTVAYKAYGNAEAADGKYWLAKLVMKNTGGSALSDLSVSYRVPDYIDWTTPDSAAEVLPGQTTVLAIYPRFPATVTRLRTRTPTQLEIKVEYTADGETQSLIEKRPFELRGVTEIEFTSIESDEIISWYDMWDNSEILAAYMTDEDEVVKAYFGKISETMGGTPYVQSVEDLGKLIGAIYNFQVGTGMVYMGAKGVPETLGDTRTLVQSVKLPREVIRGNSGTCIELTLLMSALLNQCGVKSYMALIPGHAFPLIELPNGQVVGFESTGIGGQNLGGVSSFDQALKAGNDTWAKCQKGEMPFVVVDYQAHHARGLRPPELEPIDITDLTQMLTTRVKDRTQAVQPQTTQYVNHQTTVIDNRGQDHSSRPAQPDPNFVTYRDPTGRLTLRHPRNFVSDPNAVAELQQVAPWYMSNATDLQTGWGVDVYGFASTNQQDCLAALREFGSAMGAVISFGQPQARTINGRSWSALSVSYSVNGQSFSGQLHLITVGQGTYGVGVGGPTNTLSAIEPTVMQILQTLEIHGG
ncbi:MAG: hypothetical protein AAF488_14320 [Planctomycetota bacterium]